MDDIPQIAFHIFLYIFDVSPYPNNASEIFFIISLTSFSLNPNFIVACLASVTYKRHALPETIAVNAAENRVSQKESRFQNIIFMGYAAMSSPNQFFWHPASRAKNRKKKQPEKSIHNPSLFLFPPC